MTLSTPRIALVSREYPPFFGGGIGTYARWIVPALNDAGVRVHVITEAHDRTCPRVEIGGLTTVHRVPMAMGLGGWTNAAARFSINAGRVLARLWAAGEIDIAEFAECEGAGLAHLVLSRAENRPPTIVQLHTPSEQLFVLRSLSSRRLDASLSAYFIGERMALRLADAVLAPSRFIADWAHEHYRLDVKPDVIPYATGPLPAPPGPAPADHPLTVLYAGRIEPRKGVESLILAWNRVAQDHPDAVLRLAGADTAGAPDGGSMRAYLLELLSAQAQDRVRFLGRLGHETLRREYAKASVCVIPSLWENFPNTCIESMSSARAVLVGDQGGMREMIGDSEAGRTFTAGDPDDLARALSGMLGEPRDALARRGRVARQRIEVMCDPATIAMRRIEHMREVIGRARHRREQDQTRHARAMRRSWTQLESLAGGEIPNDLGLPAGAAQVAEWVERGETTPC